MIQNTTSHLCPDVSTCWDTSGFLASGSVREAEGLLVGTARGKLAGLMTDQACDKPQKSKTQYSIPSEFRETLLAVAWRPCKGCVPGDISLDSECGYIFAGAATTVVIFSNYLLHSSQGCKVWLGPGSINHFSWKAATQVRVLQQRFSVYGTRLPCDLQIPSC